ncbi:DUF4349 domain-containing protein [Anaerosporobacter sp.]|uniref:DUF4349 domain-containing protein n=1 Tax=Anaerosporobacter sp. TaxID=1872529 RepID=UPI00286F969F|nr:DUF4349 domain-containing protein [Anaerosporobacter sp.]
MKKKFKGIFLLLLASALFTACASKGDRGGQNQKNENYTTSSKSDYAMTEEASMEMEDTAYDSDNAKVDEGGATLETNRKIIRNVSLGLETQDFEEVVAKIEAEIASLGGYAENINMSDLLSSTNRYCYITARIPAAKLDSFVSKVGETGNVVNKNMSAEDVTVNYVDMESHVKVLKTEQERLIALLEKADELEAIILLEQRLTEVRYELESYESRLRTYDNLIDYSTVSISIQEVIRYTPQVDNESTWQKMKAGLSDTLYDIVDGFNDFLIWIVSNIPYFVFWGVVIVVACLVIKRKRKKRRERSLRQEKNE